MNRKVCASILALCTCVALGFLAGCGGSSKHTVAIAATSGGGQSAQTGAAFANPLVATVTSNGSPASGVSVTFTAPATGAGGTFANGTATETDTTNSSGVATSSAFTANATAGAYSVTASATGATASASFGLTNTSPTIAITATSGGGQSAQISTAFANPLVATVTSNGSPASGVSVTFTAPATGASGTFANGTTPQTDTTTTNSSGVATSSVFTANATTGAYSVTASATGATASASFILTNTAVVAVNNTYVYYASGEESNDQYYAVAGAVTLDSSGDIIAGEQDYNDGVGITSPGEPNKPDTITPAAGALVVDATTGLGTLTMTSKNKSVGVGGVEIFAVQFVNANHALIMQFDGTATSSGSLDLQTTTATTGNFAFAVSGVNPYNDSVAYGGVFTAASGGATGTIDINDADGGPLSGTAFTATSTTPDAFGRSVVTGISNVSFATESASPAPVTFVSYAVGPEAMRIIDVDTGDTAVGSAFGQGSATFTDTSLGSSVFTLLGQWSEAYGTLGQFTTDGNGNITGTADDNELYNGVEEEASSLAGSKYNLTGSTNGYGTMTMSGTGDVNAIGLYMTDPTLNLNDPNNTTTDPGGALIVDLDAALPGGIGVITPQTDTSVSDFTGNYAAGFQDFNAFDLSYVCDGCEFDMIGPFTMTAGVLSTATIGADDSDPLDLITGVESTGDIYSSTPLSVSAGYYSMSSANSTPNPLHATLNAAATTQAFDVDIYQASGTTLYWLNWDDESVFLGPIEAQNGTAFPETRKPGPRTQAKRKQ
jgi:hypothetical protein